MSKFLLSTSIFQILLVLIMMLATVAPISAVADDVEASDESDTSVTESIKDRLQKVVEEKKDQIKGVATQGQTKRGFVAKVKRLSEESVTVETRQGPIVIPLNEKLTILQDNKPFKASNLEIDNEVTVIGFQTGEDFEARRMLVHKTNLVPTEKFIEIGTLTKLDKQSLTLTNRKGEEKIYALNKSITYEDNSGQTLKANQVTVDQDVVVLFLAEEEVSKSLKDSAGRVFRIHTLSILDEATPTSANKKTSPTTKPTATPTE